MHVCFAPKKRFLHIGRRNAIYSVPLFNLDSTTIFCPMAPRKIKDTVRKRKCITSVPTFRLDHFMNLFVTESTTQKGSKAVANGKAYENDVLNVCRRVRFMHSSVALTVETTTAGSSAGIDVTIDHDGEKIGIECKRKFAAGMQLSLQYDIENNRWRSGGKNKIPNDAKDLFEQGIGDTKIYNNKVPAFVNNNITHEEWVRAKKNFGDQSIPCSSDLISKMYYAKGCSYIQVGTHGLFHTHKDICDFGVPYFECESTIRIRTKIHSRKNKQGFMMASVSASVVPKIARIVRSIVSLDSFDNLPKNVVLVKN